MEGLEAAIARTILYGDIFHFAMSRAEIHHFLIHDEQVTLEQIAAMLQRSTWLNQLLLCEADYIALRAHADYISVRRTRSALADAMLARAQRYGSWLAALPFVRMVALTGALAMRNPAHPRDDYDYLLLVQPGRVWLARAAAIVLVRLMRIGGVALCPNYVLATDKLPQTRRDLYIAHEVAQMIPVAGIEWYEKMWTLNAWVACQLPNAQARLLWPVSPGQAWLKRLIEQWLGGRLGDALEAWEANRKQRRFQVAAQQATTAAVIDRSMVKGHFKDHGQRVLEEYQRRLCEYGLDEQAGLARAGD